MAEQPQHSWVPRKITETGVGKVEPPSIIGLFYQRFRHLIAGEPGAMKGWLAAVAIAIEIAAGHDVLWFDLDGMGDQLTLERLYQLGLTKEQIDQHFIYFKPGEATDAEILAELVALVAERQPTIIVWDSYIGLLDAHGRSENDPHDIQFVITQIVDPIRAAAPDAASLLLDHVTKDKDTRGNWSTGSQRKKGTVEVFYMLEVAKAFGKGKHGMARIKCYRDRGGYYSIGTVAELHLHSHPDTHDITWEIIEKNPHDDDGGDDDEFRPTAIMENVSRWVEKQLEPVSKSGIRDAVNGQATYMTKALEILIREGFLRPEGKRNGSPTYVAARAYRAIQDPLSDTYSGTPADPCATPAAQGPTKPLRGVSLPQGDPAGVEGGISGSTPAPESEGVEDAQTTLDGVDIQPSKKPKKKGDPERDYDATGKPPSTNGNTTEPVLRDTGDIPW